jgi:hypothetical protein
VAGLLSRLIFHKISGRKALEAAFAKERAGKEGEAFLLKELQEFVGADQKRAFREIWTRIASTAARTNSA